MSDPEDDITNAPYPANFTPPPGAPVPTAEDFKAASTSHGAGIGSTDTGIPWWYWAAGGAALLGVAGLYVAYHATKKAAPLLLAYHAPELLPHYQAMNPDQSTQDAALQNLVADLAKQASKPTPAVYSALQARS
jgi:hypothetical protein